MRGPITLAAPEMTRKAYSLVSSHVDFRSQPLRAESELSDDSIKSISRSQSASAFLIISSFTIDFQKKKVFIKIRIEYLNLFSRQLQIWILLLGQGQVRRVFQDCRSLTIVTEWEYRERHNQRQRCDSTQWHFLSHFASEKATIFAKKLFNIFYQQLSGPSATWRDFRDWQVGLIG